MIKRFTGEKGFTIVELMMATTVFSMVLLVCSYSLLEIGRAYYKGATINRTQETARVIMDDVTEAIKFEHGAIQPNAVANARHCIGSRQYDFTLGVMQADGGALQLSRSDVSGCGAAGSNAQSLLANRTRILTFTINETAPGSNTYNVVIRVASGEDAMLTATDGNGLCRNERWASQFCAVIELQTTVRRRV